MAQVGTLSLSGTVLRAQLPWLEEHAANSEDGRLYCKKHGQDHALLPKTHHRYRMNESGPDAPFMKDVHLPDKTGLGEMHSFITFCCTTCNDRPEVPDAVHEHELVFFKHD